MHLLMRLRYDTICSTFCRTLFDGAKAASGRAGESRLAQSFALDCPDSFTEKMQQVIDQNTLYHP